MSCSCGNTNCSSISFRLPGDCESTSSSTSSQTGLLLNADINVSTATTSSETLYTFSVPAGTLDEAGDQLIIRSYWSTNAASSTASKVVKIKIGGNDINPNNITTYPLLGAGIHSTYYEVKLTRITATTAAVAVDIRPSGAFGIIPLGLKLHSPNANYAPPQTVPNLTTGTQAITFEADGSVIGDITLDHVTILKVETL